MSYQDGLAAMNLEMPPRVPRFEPDADRHWKLVSAVTGIPVGPESGPDEKLAAQAAFHRAWNIDLCLSALIFSDEFGEQRTRMGHASYEAAGEDYDNRIVCPFKEPEEVLAFDPWEAFGAKDPSEIVRRFNAHYAALEARFPTMVRTSGVYITLFTGLIYLFGWDMLLTAGGLDPDGLGEVANRYARWIAQYYQALAESDVRFVYSHDDLVWTSGAVFHPDWYRKYIFPHYRDLFYPKLIEAGKKIIFVCDGNYTEFVDDVAATGVHGFFFEPMTDLDYIASRYGKTHVMIGNVDTRMLLYGTRAQIRGEVERCMASAKHCPGYFISVSNMIPHNTPVESALYYNEVYEKLCRR